jgi:hypothetical protein
VLGERTGAVRPYGGVVRWLREADGRRPALMRGV